MMYLLGMFSIAVFAITGVIAAHGKRLDIFSVVFLGVVTALGGGTIRDLILGQYPVYWVADVWFLWIAAGTALIAFFIDKSLQNRHQFLLYLDALGIALFSITAAEKTLALGLSASIAVVMGLITAIFGSILRDILTGSPCLLLSNELYATPVLIGLSVFVLLDIYFPAFVYAVPCAIALIFIFRACAIYFKWHYPKWLISE